MELCFPRAASLQRNFNAALEKSLSLVDCKQKKCKNFLKCEFEDFLIMSLLIRQSDVKISIDSIPQIVSVKGKVFILAFLIHLYPGHFVCLAVSDSNFIKYNCLSKDILIFKGDEKVNPQLLFYVQKKDS